MQAASASFLSVPNLALMIVALLCAGVFFHPRLRTSPAWRATVTPLASIIGSGFLVAGPILAHAAGTKAWMAMTGLCLVAYLFGAAIRYNIAHVEPALARPHAKTVSILERASQGTLSLAYFISVAYYINLFAAFGLRFGDITDPFWIRVIATVVIAFLGVMGGVGGLRALERLEVAAVGLKLCVIAGLLAALGIATGLMLAGGDFTWTAPSHPHGWSEFQILLGLVILVQGFETSRYLGDEYDRETRVKTMRRAQWLSTAIYISFVLLITGYFKNGLPAEGGETAIIDMLAPLGVAAAPMIILAALASQFSAAVADMNGAGGLLSETSKQKFSVNAGDVITAVVAIAIIWAANIYEIIAYASKAFVLYYALQSLQAALAARRNKSYALMALFAFCVALAAVIVVFAAPAEV